MRGRVMVAIGLLAAVSLTGCGSSQPIHIPRGPMGPERIRLEVGPELAPASTTALAVPVDGARCKSVEQLAYHIHAHLEVFVAGHERRVPGGVGIVGAVAEPTRYGPIYGALRCYYWLHTHTADGIIHIESPLATTYTLGTFFDIWRQPLGRSVVAGARGKVTAFLNGKPWAGNPRTIPLRSHAKIQLDVGDPVVPFQPVSFDHSAL